MCVFVFGGNDGDGTQSAIQKNMYSSISLIISQKYSNKKRVKENFTKIADTNNTGERERIVIEIDIKRV